MSDTPARFWIGPSGWSYNDWYGIVYPSVRPRGFKPLAWLAELFDAVEVNSSFYRIPTAAMTESWVTQTPPRFRFAFKLTQAFTHEPGAALEPALAAQFLDALRPVRQAGKLGPLLMQFPWSFRYTAQNVQRLRRLAELFADLDRVIEVRHASWAQPEALEAIRACGGYCNIDQPPLRACLPPTTHVFGPIAYVRLHGRNAAHWFAENQPAFERYNYLYSEQELREWVQRLNVLARQARDVYVFANNHYRGQGVSNALELRWLVEGRRCDPGEQLLRAFPRLRHLALPPREPGLFDALP